MEGEKLECCSAPADEPCVPTIFRHPPHIPQSRRAGKSLASRLAYCLGHPHRRAGFASISTSAVPALQVADRPSLSVPVSSRPRTVACRPANFSASPAWLTEREPNQNRGGIRPRGHRENVAQRHPRRGARARRPSPDTAAGGDTLFLGGRGEGREKGGAAGREIASPRHRGRRDGVSTMTGERPMHATLFSRQAVCASSCAKSQWTLLICNFLAGLSARPCSILAGRDT